MKQFAGGVGMAKDAYEAVTKNRGGYIGRPSNIILGGY